MRMSLHPDLSEISPGDEVELQITVANDATTEVTPIIDVQGLDADLWALANPIPVIAPGAVGRTSLRVRLPDDSPPGDRTVAVTARAPGADAGASAVTVLRVGTNYSLAVETDPSSVTGRSGGRLNTVVRNLGDEDLDVTMSGRSEGAEVEMRPATFTLPAGKGARLGAVITPLKRSWFSERRHGVVIEARSGSVPSSTTAMFVQRPTVPPLLLRITAVVLALAVWASVSFVLFDRISGDPEVAAPVDTVVDGGDAGPPADVVLAGAATDEDDAGVTPPVVIAGTVEGPREPSGSSVLVERVSFGDEGTTGGSTGKIAAGTPVVFSSGTVLEKISATTDEGGRFRVGSGLIADAFYRVTVSRAGFDLTSQVVTTGGGNTEIDLAITLVPGRGQMTGRVTGLVDTVAEIVATQGTVTYRTTTASEGDGVGTWQIDGLATPATYLVTIIADGHASQQLTVEVGGGAAVSGVDATMERDRGTIRGAITYRDDGVGAVTVALDGDVSRTTTTLTVGDVAGSFDFPNLPYGTYLLTFSKDGWLTQSREVTVASGDVAVDVSDLLPSTATITGAVLQQVSSGSCAYPDPTATGVEVGVGSCGGVGVSVIGENGTWRTTTRTGDGKFHLSGIPAGEYTVEFERYGYRPEFYRVTVGPGDTLTLPDDATYDVEMAAYRGPSDRPLQPLNESSITLTLIEPVALDEAIVTGTLRKIDNQNTAFDELVGVDGKKLFTKWSEGCRDDHLTVEVNPTQNNVVCTLTPGGGFKLEGVAPGAVNLTLTAPGFGSNSVTLQVSADGETPAGLILMTPGASLSMNVTGSGDIPIEGASVFITPSANSQQGSILDAPGSTSCTVVRDNDNDIWQKATSEPSPTQQTKSGICVDTDFSGDATFEDAFGSGTFDVIVPVNDADPSDATKLAGIVPLDHQQLTRQVDLQLGVNSRLDVTLRRYASIVGTIQVPNASGTGYTNLTTIEGLAGSNNQQGFPYTFGYDSDGNPRGVRFCEIYLTTDVDIPVGSSAGECRPYERSFVTPRFSFGGVGTGLPAGSFRIDRIPPNESARSRKYLISFATDDGNFELSPELAAGGIDGLSYGEDRSVSAVVSPTLEPARLNFVWSKAGDWVKVPEAQVTVSGISDFRSLEVPPYRESVEVVCPSAACNSTALGEDDRLFVISPSVSASAGFMTPLSTGDDAGSIIFDNVFRTGTLTVSAERTGFNALNQTVALTSARGDGARVVMVPTPRPVSGTFFVEPAASTELLNGMTMTLTPVQGGLSLTATATAVNSSSPAAGATVSFGEVPPGRYDIVVAGDGLVTTELGELDLDPLGELDLDPEGSVKDFNLDGYFDLAARTIEAEKTLVVNVKEDPPGDDDEAAVPNVRVRLEDDAGALVGIVNTCTASENKGGAVGCTAAGEARFTGLSAGEYMVRAAAPSGDGYKKSSDVEVELTNGALDDNGDPTVETKISVEVVRFGAISGRSLGQIVDGSDATSLAGASVTLYEVDGGEGGNRSTKVKSITSGSDGSYSFPATDENEAGWYEIVISLDGYTEVSVRVEVVAGTATSVAEEDTTLTAKPAHVTGKLTDSTTSLALPFVRVKVFGSDSCAGPGTSSTAPADESGDDCAWTITDGTLPVDDPVAGTFMLPPRPVTLEFAEYAWDGSEWKRTERPVLERSFTPVADRGLDVTTTIAPAFGSLSGTVNLRNYDGAAVSSGAGASVAIYVLNDGGNLGSAVAGPVTAGTDGSYSFASLAVGNYGLKATYAGYTDSAVQTISVVAGGAVTVPAVTLTATARSVTVSVVSGDDGASALGNLTVVATPPSAGVALTAQTAVTNGSGQATFTLAPGVWSVASSDGATANLQIGGVAVAKHLDASAVSLTVPVGVGAFDHTADSGSPLISFVKVSGTITGAAYTGATGVALSGADVSISGVDLADSSEGAWSAFVPVSTTARDLTVAASATGYDAGSATVSVASSAVTGADIELIAAAKTATVRVSSGGGAGADADLEGLSLQATQRDGVAVTPVTADITTSDGSNDGTRTFTFVGLSPGVWTIQTSGGADLSIPHLDVSAADGVRVTVGSTDVDVSDPIIDFIGVTGTVYELPYASGTPAALNGATVSVDSDTSVSSLSSGAGTWEIRVPERATARSIAVTATSASHGSGSGTFTVPAAGDNATNDPATGSDLNLVATPRNVTVRATSGGSGFPLQGLKLRATPPVGSGLASVTANAVTGAQGFATFANLAPTTWTISSTNGGDYTLQVDGVDVAEHLDASGVTLEVPVGTGLYNHFTSTNNSLLQFVTISGTVSALNEAGTASSPLGGAVVAANTDSDVTATTDPSGGWSIRVLSGSSGLQFDVTATSYITSAITDVSTANPTGRNVTLTPTSAAVSATFEVVSSADSTTAVTGVSLTLTPTSGSSVTAADDDDDGIITVSGLEVKDYVVTVVDENDDGVADGATNHLATGPLNSITGEDTGRGPRMVSVSSGLGSQTIELAKLDTGITGTIGTAADDALAALNGATVTLSSTVGPAVSYSATLTGNDLAAETLAVTSDRPWTVTVSKTSYATAMRAIAIGGSGALGRVTLASATRTVSGALTGPAGATVTITASARGYADATSTTQVAIDTGTVSYSLAGLSTDVTWRLDFSVTEAGTTTTVSRWVANGAGDVTLNQTVGGDAIGSIRIVVVDTAETAARTGSLTVDLKLVESTSPGASTTTSLPIAKSVEGGLVSTSLTLVAGQNSESHTFANLIKPSASTDGLLDGRFSVTVTPSSGYSVDVEAGTLTGLDPNDQTLLIRLSPNVRTVTTTLFDSKGTSDTGDDDALGNRTVTLTRTIDGAVNTIPSSVDGTTTNLYTFSGVLPGTWSLTTPGFSSVPVLVQVETADPASPFSAGTLRLLSSTDRLDASTVTASPTSVAVEGTSTITVQLADGNGNLAASGGQVRLFTDRGAIGPVTDNDNGTYTATFTAPTTIGLVTIRASLDGQMLSDTATVDVVAGTADAGESTISLSRASLPADGTSTGTITIRLADANGNPIRTGGATVSFSESSSGLALSGSVTPHGDGSYSQLYTAGTTVGTTVISATVDGSAAGSVSVATTQVTDRVRYSEVTTGSSTLTAGGPSTTVTVTLKSGASSTLSESAGTVALFSSAGTIGVVSDGTDGTYTASFTPPTTAGRYVIWATLDGLTLSQTAVVTVKAGVAVASTSSVTADRFSLPADGSSAGTIIVTLRDAYGNVLDGSAASESVGVSVTGGGVLVESTASQQDNGTYAVTYTAAAAVSTGVVTATLDPSGTPTTIGSLSISNTPVTAIGQFSTLSADMASVRVGGSAVTVSVQLKDGADVGDTTSSTGVFALYSSGGSISVTSNTLSSDGALTASFTPPTTTGPVAIWATLDGQALSASTTVTVTAGLASASTSSVTADRFSLPADGLSQSMIIVTLRDASGNVLDGSAASETVSVTVGGVEIAAVKQGNGTYAATFTAPSTPGASAITAKVGPNAIGTITLASTQVTDRVRYSSVTSSSDTFTAGGASPTMTVTLKSDASSSLTASGGRVALHSASGSFSVVTDQGDGTYTATFDPPDIVGDVVVWATLDGLALEDVAVITVEPAAASAAASSVSIARSVLPADGGSTTTVTVTVRDSFGNVRTAGGDTGDITLAVTGGGSIGSVTDNSDGTYSATFTSTASVGTSVVSAEIDDSAAGSVSVLRTRVSQVTTMSTLSVSSSSTTAGGSTVTATVQLVDAGGSIDSDVGDVVIRSTAGSVGSTSFAVGSYTAAVTPPTATGTMLVWATIDGVALSDSAVITVNPGSASTGASTVTASSTSLPADGASTSTITVALRDAYLNSLSASGGTVVVLVASGSGEVSSVTDNDDGTYTATYTAGSVSGVARIEATVGDSKIADSAFITLTSGTASAAQTTIDVSDSSFVADGSSTVTVTVQPRDSNGNVVTTGSHTIVVSSTVGTISDSGAPTRQVDGSYTVTLTSPTTTGTATVTATLGGVAITDTASVRAVADAPSISTSTLSVGNNSLVANGTATTTVTIVLRDANSNPLDVSGGTVTASVSGDSGPVGSVGSVTDNRDGTYSVVYTSGSSVGSDTISASVGGSTITDTVTVSVVAAAPEAPSWTSTAAGDQQVTVSWSEPEDNGSPITGYVVEYSADGGVTWIEADPGPGSNTTVTVSGLTNGTEYLFRVYARNTAGTSTASSETRVTPTA